MSGELPRPAWHGIAETVGLAPAVYLDDDDYEPCEHDCDEECDPCHHEHCWKCGGCGCPGYCDDYQTYNLRPAETGGTK